MVRRRGAGGILLVAFAFAVLVVSSVPLLVPTQVSADETFHWVSYDMRDFAAGLAAEASYLPPSERMDFVNASLSSYRERMADRGVTVAFFPDNDTGDVWYYVEHGNSSAVGIIPVKFPVGSGGGGGGGGSGGNGGGGGGGGPCVLNESCAVEFNIESVSRGSFGLTGSLEFRASNSFDIRMWRSWRFKKYRVSPGDEVRIELAENDGFAYLKFNHGEVVVGSLGIGKVWVTSITVNGEEITEGRTWAILMSGKYQDGSLKADVNMVYHLDAGDLNARVTDGEQEWSFPGGSDPSGVNVKINHMRRGEVEFAGFSWVLFYLKTEGCADQVQVGEFEFPAESCGSGGGGGGGQGSAQLPPVKWSPSRIRAHVPSGGDFKVIRAAFLKNRLYEPVMVRVQGGPEVVGAHITVFSPFRVIRESGNKFEFEMSGRTKAVVAFFIFNSDALQGLNESTILVYPLNGTYSGPDYSDTLTIEWIRCGECPGPEGCGSGW